MNDSQRLAALRIVLIVVGLIALFAIWPLMVLWPSGWAWHSGHSAYPMMIVGIYATLGVFLLIASRDPLRHLSLIWFTVWSSIVHGVIMAVQSFGMDGSGEPHLGHLVGDVPALFIVAAALAFVTPRGERARALARVPA
jgi:peptidoglycan/LPS O-acetylase OafA/YrhL